MEIQYLKLKEKVLKTEEELLMDGIDTSEYPLFSMNDEGKNTEDQILVNFEATQNDDPPINFSQEHSGNESQNGNKIDLTNEP